MRMLYLVVAAALGATAPQAPAAAQSAQEYEMVLCDSVAAAEALIIASRGTKRAGYGAYGRGCELRLVAQYRRNREAHPFWYGGRFFKIVAVQVLKVHDKEPVPAAAKYSVFQTTEELTASIQ
jgi:hypothetical protein